RSPRSPLVPYTTLFRSNVRLLQICGTLQIRNRFLKLTTQIDQVLLEPTHFRLRLDLSPYLTFRCRLGGAGQNEVTERSLRDARRSEEHTSELQSRENLV